MTHRTIDVVLVPRLTTEFRPELPRGFDLVPLDGWLREGRKATPLSLLPYLPINIPMYPGVDTGTLSDDQDRDRYLDLIKISRWKVELPGHPIVAVEVDTVQSSAETRSGAEVHADIVVNCRVVTPIDEVRFIVARDSLMRLLSP